MLTSRRIFIGILSALPIPLFLRSRGFFAKAATGLTQLETVAVNVDCDTVLNTMRGGLGASWHAMNTPMPDLSCGSAWGACPPAEDDRAWQQVYRHASWLGLDWNRVETNQVIYEPERGKFSFDNPDMRIVFNVKQNLCFLH